MKEKGRTIKANGVCVFAVIFAVLTFLSSICLGKIISSSITYRLENPYHFEKVVAEVVDTEFYEAAHNKYWLDFYCLIACYTDEETGKKYYAQLTKEIHDKEEAESHIGEKTYILIDRQYGRAHAYIENARKGGAPIDIIVFSVLLALCLSVSICCIVKIAKKNKKHLIWISIYIVLMLGLASYVAYMSLDMNYLEQLKM